MMHRFRIVLAGCLACAWFVFPLAVSAHNAPMPDTTTQVDPMAQTYFAQGQAYEKQRQWGLAIQAYQQAVRVDPKLAEAWSNMGFSYRKLQQYDNAIDAYKQALAINPDLAYAHDYMARTYVAMGNTDEAMRQYEILKRLDPKMADRLLKAIKANNPDLGDED